MNNDLFITTFQLLQRCFNITELSLVLLCTMSDQHGSHCEEFLSKDNRSTESEPARRSHLEVVNIHTVIFAMLYNTNQQRYLYIFCALRKVRHCVHKTIRR